MHWNPLWYDVCRVCEYWKNITSFRSRFLCKGGIVLFLNYSRMNELNHSEDWDKTKYPMKPMKMTIEGGGFIFQRTLEVTRGWLSTLYKKSLELAGSPRCCLCECSMWCKSICVCKKTLHHVYVVRLWLRYSVTALHLFALVTKGIMKGIIYFPNPVYLGDKYILLYI